MHFKVKQRKAYHLETLTQVISNNSTVGHVAPYPYKIRDDIKNKIMNFAQSIAYKGVKEYFGIDVAAVNDNKGFNYLIMECNPRYTFATYPIILAKRLNVDMWRTKIYKISNNSFCKINLKSLYYDKHKKSGIIFIDWGMVMLGEITIMIIGNIKEQEKIDYIIKENI